jgi:hypothetical protein
MPKYRAENSHLIEGAQVKKEVKFLAESDDEAKEIFAFMLKDKTIQESGLFQVKGNRLVTEYVGYV